MKRISLFGALLAISLAAFSPAFAQDGSPQPRPSRTPPSLPAPTKNVYETLAANKDTSKFAEMVNDAGLKSLLSGPADEPVTVFAPSNEAIEKISRDDNKQIEASKTATQSWVKYHFITNSLVGSSAIKGRKVTPVSANGEAIVFDGTSKKDPPHIGDASLVQSDILATNGVVHIVSTAMMPPSMGGKVSAMPVMEPPKMPPPPAPPAAAEAPASLTVKAVSPASATTSHAAATTTPGTATSPLGASTTGTPAKSTTTSVPTSATTTGSIPEVPADKAVPASGDR